MSLNKLDKIVQQIHEEHDKLQKGNKSAAPRLRKHCQELKEVAQQIRVDALKKQKAIPKKKGPKRK